MILHVHPKGNQSWISLEGLVLKLKLQHFGHLKRRTDSFENTLMLGKIEGGGKEDNRAWDGWMASPTQQTWVWVNSGSWWWTGRPDVLQSMGSQRVGHDWATELNWMWDLSSQTRDWTHVHCIGRWILNHWTTREILPLFLQPLQHLWECLMQRMRISWVNTDCCNRHPPISVTWHTASLFLPHVTLNWWPSTPCIHSFEFRVIRKMKIRC